MSERVRSKKNWLIIVTVIAVLSAVAGIVAGSLITSPAENAAKTKAPKATLITSEIKSEKITTSIITRGSAKPEREITIGYGALIKDQNEGVATTSNEAIVTAVHANAGDELKSGSVILEVSGRPIIVLPGERPMYRTIKPGMNGPDVRQLQEALSDLGYFKQKIDGNYGESTKKAVEKLYQNLGYETITTDNNDGSDKSNLRQAQQQLTQAQNELSELQQQAANDPNITAGAITNAKTRVTYASENLNELQQRTGTVLPQTEIVFVPTLPAHLTQVTTNIGYAAPEVLAVLAPSALRIEATVPPEKTPLLQVGQQAELEDDTGASGSGIITEIGGPNGQGQTVVYIQPETEIAFQNSGVGYKITFTTAQTNSEVLTVPLGAISSDVKGNASIILVGPEEKLTRIPIKTGIAGDGIVEITPTDGTQLNPGDTVLIGG